MKRLAIFFLLLSLPLLSSATSCLADQWDEVFDSPRYFETRQGVHLRAAPSKNSGILVTLKSGEPLKVTALESGWYKATRTDGTTGYVFKRFLNPLDTVPQGFGQEPAPAPEPAAQPEPAPTPEPVSAPEPAPVPEPAPAPVVQPEPAPLPEPQAIEPDPAPGDSVVTEGADCKRVRFKSGASSGSVERILPPGETHCYQIGVSKNQWMEVWLTSGTDNVTFQIFTPSGISVTAGETHWLGRTDADGDFILIVGSQDQAESAYNLKIQIK